MAFSAVAKLKKLQEQAWALFGEKHSAHTEEAHLSKSARLVHFWVRVIKSFIRNRCALRASALSYTTLLALIPLLAVVVSVSTSIIRKDSEKTIQELIEKIATKVAPQLSLVTAPGDEAEGPGGPKKMAATINEFIVNIQSGKLGAAGVVGLIFVGIMLLARIEETFNDIWGVTHGRSLFSQIVHYWAAITLGPLLILTALGLKTSQHFTATQEWLGRLPLMEGTFFAFLPYVLFCGTFALFYKMIPNTQVNWSAALVGAAIAGYLAQLNTLFNGIYVSQVITSKQIYGHLGILPVFLIGLYFSWLIMLLGAQIAYAFQNRHTYFQDRLAENVNQRGREFIALRLMIYIGQQFQTGSAPPTAALLADNLGIPSRLVSLVLSHLTQAQLVRELGEGHYAYVPGRPLDKITCDDILHAMRAFPGQELLTREEPIRGLLREEYERIRQAERDLAGSITLDALVSRAGALSAAP